MCGDLESAYFAGERMSRVLLLRQPRSGLPGLKPDDRLLARVPVYGTQDAGRGYWKKFRRNADLVERVRMQLLVLWARSEIRC